MKRNHPEQDLQKGILEYLALARSKAGFFTKPFLAFHVPNGGARSPIEAAILKGLGVVEGMPDLLFLWRNGAAGLECKAPQEKQSGPQKRVEVCFRTAGIPYRIARSLEDAETAFLDWGLISRGLLERNNQKWKVTSQS